MLHPQTDVTLERLCEEIDNGQYLPNASDRKLWAHEIISACWPGGPSHNKLHIFISLPDRPIVGAIGVCFIRLCPIPGYLMDMLPEDAEGLGVMEHPELRAHGYEVKPPEGDIEDGNGGVMEPLYRHRVRQPLSTCTPR